MKDKWIYRWDSEPSSKGSCVNRHTAQAGPYKVFKIKRVRDTHMIRLIGEEQYRLYTLLYIYLFCSLLRHRI